MRKFKGLNINIKCTDKNNKVGTFLTNDNGEQVTKTYKSSDALFKSVEYSNIRY